MYLPINALSPTPQDFAITSLKMVASLIKTLDTAFEDINQAQGSLQLTWSKSPTVEGGINVTASYDDGIEFTQQESEKFNKYLLAGDTKKILKLINSSKFAKTLATQ